MLKRVIQRLRGEIPDVNPRVYRHGEHIATIIDLEPREIERIVKTAAKKSGQKIDWQYFWGCAAVKALGNLERARTYLISELEERGHTLYRSSADQDTLAFIPWPQRL
jgi:hypothetical protein